MTEKKRISEEVLIHFATKIITALGAPEARARATAEILAAADMRGISSHGVAGGTGLRELVERIQKDAIDSKAIPRIKRNENWAVATMDAKAGIGPAAAMDATHLAGDLAEVYGIGKVYVHNANHFGAACVYVEALIERGLAGRATCTSGAWMKPFGGNRIRLGTNPIAWGVPAGDQAIVIDVATTQRAVSPAIRASRAGEAIPADYFLHENGEVMSGHMAYEELIKGSVLPLGGTQFGYKGSGLAVLVDLDGVIGGGSTQCIPTLRVQPDTRITQTIEAWRLDALYPIEDAKKRLAEAVRDIKSCGGPEMLLPGEREARKKTDAEKNGIPYEASQWNTLKMIGGWLGVDPPEGMPENLPAK